MCNLKTYIMDILMREAWNLSFKEQKQLGFFNNLLHVSDSVLEFA